MTERHLACYVTLQGPPPDLGLVYFGPKDNPLPAWALEVLKDSDHLFVPVGESEGRHAAVVEDVAPAVQAEHEAKELASEALSTAEKSKAPSRNKSAATWEAYLRSHGVDFPEASSRDTLIDIAEREGLA